METWNKLTVMVGGERDNGGKKGTGLDKEHVWVTHGHGQHCGNWLGAGGGMGGGGKRGKNWDNYNRITIKKWKKRTRGSPSVLASVCFSPLVSPPFLYLVLCLWKSKLSRISMTGCRFIEVEIRDSSCSGDIVTSFWAIVFYCFLCQIHFISVQLKHLEIKITFLNLMLYSDSESLKFLPTHYFI